MSLEIVSRLPYTDAYQPICGIYWNQYGSDASTLSAQYFNGDTLVSCCQLDTQDWLNIDTWYEFSIVFTDSSVLFSVEDSIFAESGSDICMPGNTGCIRLYGQSRASFHYVDNISVTHSSNWDL